MFEVLAFAGLYSREADNIVRLPDLVDAALTNRGNIRAARIDAQIAGLQTSQVSSNYLPLISFAYDFRYNILTPSQIVPIGQFFPVPTDETRPIRFGTDWQQNAGISFYQPLINLSLQSRINESRINERIRNNDAEHAEAELKSEVLKSFALIWLREEQLKSASLDTIRTYRTKELLLHRLNEGQNLKSELNRATVSHNNSVDSYRTLLKDFFNEKIYLSFLTGLPVQMLLGADFDFTAFTGQGNFARSTTPAFDSIPEIINLELRADLAGQQQKTLRSAYLPVIGLEGFYGANQYTDTFNPFLGSRWFGASFIGLNLRVPIVTGESTRSRTDQLKLQAEGIRYRMDDQKNLINNRLLRLNGEVSHLSGRITLMRENINLLEENINLYQERFTEGQISAYDLVNFEIDLQKAVSGLNEQAAEMINKQIELITVSGRLDAFIENLRM